MVREELLWMRRTPHERVDGGSPCDAYPLDFPQFRQLLASMSPWGRGQFGESLAARMFRVGSHSLSKR